MALILTDQNGNQYSLSVNAVDGSLSVVPVPAQTPSANQGPVSFTGMNLLMRAGRAAGILAAGEQFIPGDANDALAIANGMIDTWTSERFMIFQIVRQTFALNSGQQTYTMGPTAVDFIVPRPPKISGAGVITSTNPLQPLELPLDMVTVDEWKRIPVKAIQGALPLQVWDDDDFPNRNLSLWPIPNVGGLDIALYTWTLLTQLTLAGTFSFPPAYYEALVYNLAIRIAAEWPGTVTPAVETLAALAIQKVKVMNMPILDLRCDPALNSPKKRAYNWLSDTPVRTL